MPAYDFDNIQRSADLHLGLRADRAATAHLAAVTPYFTIAGGPVLLTGLIGTVTVQATGGPENFHWETLPTNGAVSPVCALLDVDPAVIGSLLTITGVATVAMTYNVSGTGLAMMTTNVVLSIGALNAEIGDSTGTTSWTMFYLPLTEAAYVIAA